MQPHLIRSWLPPSQEEQCDAKVADICQIYHEAPALDAQGERIVSTDELTGVQALERLHPGLPLAPGKVERRECAYIRHGTGTFIISRDVVSGHILAPSCGTTRTEVDFLAHVQAVVATDPTAARWHFVADNLDIHRSASLVRYVAARSGLEIDVGEKGKRGILHHRQSRAAFLSDPGHRIVFHYTPKHCSWLNQVEIWLSIVVRKLLKRGSFLSVEDFKRKFCTSSSTTIGRWPSRFGGPTRGSPWLPKLSGYLGSSVLAPFFPTDPPPTAPGPFQACSGKELGEPACRHVRPLLGS